jgi:hypothetical protein
MHADRQAFCTNENTPEKRDGEILIKKFFDLFALQIFFFLASRMRIDETLPLRHQYRIFF